MTPNVYNLSYIPLIRVGVAQILGLALGITQILAFLDNNMLVYPTQNCGVGGLSQHKDPNANGFASQWNIGFNVTKQLRVTHSGSKQQ